MQADDDDYRDNSLTVFVKRVPNSFDVKAYAIGAGIYFYVTLDEMRELVLEAEKLAYESFKDIKNDNHSRNRTCFKIYGYEVSVVLTKK